MDTPSVCQSCGKPVLPDAPQGVCPECLMRAGLATETGGRERSATSRFVPPSTEELAPHFPQLELLGFIGQGGMGAVYKARQKQLDRIVALKILPPQAAAGPGFAERFTREARALARLNHPNIVTLYEFGCVPGVGDVQPSILTSQPPLYYFLMEFVDGVNLEQLLQSGRLAPSEALAIIPQICDALQFARERGIVHRDIKPGNILLSKAGQVKIADFGVAKIVAESLDETAGAKAGPSSSALTKAGTVLGTPPYLAPEQIARPLEVDHRADIYSLGVVLYQMLTGELPSRPIEPPSRKVQIDVRLDEIVLRALEANPERRYSEASVFKTELETLAGTFAAPAKVSPSRANFRHYYSGSYRLRDCWMWDPRMAWLFFLVPLFVTAVLIPILFQRVGFYSLWLLAFDAGGLGLALTYVAVGMKVRRLKTTPPAKAGEVAEVLIAGRTFESPGVAILRPETIELVPIAGGPISLSRHDIVSVRKITWFNGHRLWTKAGLMLELAGGARIGIALARPTGQRWFTALSPKRE